jgi:hypothetical protein
MLKALSSTPEWSSSDRTSSGTVSDKQDSTMGEAGTEDGAEWKMEAESESESRVGDVGVEVENFGVCVGDGGVKVEDVGVEVGDVGAETGDVGAEAGGVEMEKEVEISH